MNGGQMRMAAVPAELMQMMAGQMGQKEEKPEVELIPMDQAIAEFAQARVGYEELIGEACQLRDKLDKAEEVLEAAERRLHKAAIFAETGKVDVKHDCRLHEEGAEAPAEDDEPEVPGGGVYL